MKYIKDAEYDYEAGSISEENGYIKWYDQKKESKRAQLFGIYANILFWLLFHFSLKHNEDPLKELSALEFVLFVVFTVAAILFVGYCLKGLVSLLILSNGKLSDRCVISLKNTTAIYNAETSRARVLASYIVPLILLVSVFAIISLLTSGIIKAFFIFQILPIPFISSSDIYLFFLCLRKTKKGDIIFGEYKKKL